MGSLKTNMFFQLQPHGAGGRSRICYQISRGSVESFLPNDVTVARNFEPSAIEVRPNRKQPAIDKC